jgi:uncharacterized membrane protein (UPF0127 family)
MKILLVGVVAVAIVGGTMIVIKNYQMPTDNQTSIQTPENVTADSRTEEEKVIASWYAPLTSFTFGRISLQASIADTDAERAQGLSDTPYIPAGIAKVFIFDSAQQWSFWMKDMNYSIDIFWLDADGHVVHVVENASPDTYPDISFVPPVPAKYVIETKAGFAAENNIGVGAIANIAPLERAR